MAGIVPGVVLALVILGGGLGGDPLPVSEPTAQLRARPVARTVVVAQSGDTLWRIARRLQPDGDIRPLVDRLAATRGRHPLQVGERIALP